MRNPKRIPKILNQIEEIWKKNPDLRLGQLLEWACIMDKTDLFYVEDFIVCDNLERIHGIKAPKYKYFVKEGFKMEYPKEK